MANRHESLIGPTEGKRYKVDPVPSTPEAQAKGWHLTVNNEPFEGPLQTMELSSPFGRVIYGQRPEGYPGWVFEEVGKGGSVIVPYYIDGEHVYIGVVAEIRPTATDGDTSQTVLNLPRGFLNPEETHFAAAEREFAEETGYVPLDERIVELPGDPMNPNSTFFVTGNGKGVHLFAIKLQADELRITAPSEDPREREFGFDLELRPMSKIGEKITGCKFIHWTKAASTRDMFTVAGVGRLMANLAEASKDTGLKPRPQ